MNAVHTFTSSVYGFIDWKKNLMIDVCSGRCKSWDRINFLDKK